MDAQVKRGEMPRVAEKVPPLPTTDDQVAVNLAPVFRGEDAGADVSDVRRLTGALDFHPAAFPN